MSTGFNNLPRVGLYNDFEDEITKVDNFCDTEEDPFKVIHLTQDEVDAIKFWRGRNEWSSACLDFLIKETKSIDSQQSPEENDSETCWCLQFNTLADLYNWKETVEGDADGGHQMFSGIIGSFRCKLFRLYNSTL